MVVFLIVGASVLNIFQENCEKCTANYEEIVLHIYIQVHVQ